MFHNLLLLGASLATTLVLLELGMRAFFAPPPVWREPQTKHVSSPLLGWALAPESDSFSIDAPVSTNALGLRDEPLSREKPAGQTRVLALGDSFTFALGVRFPDLWVQQLERRLEAELPAQDPQVINAAVAGYNTRQELLYLLAEGFALEPDLVIVAFYWNDLVGNEAPLPDPATTPRYAPSVDGTHGDGEAHRIPRSLRDLLRRSVLLYQGVIRTKALWHRLDPPDDVYARVQRALLRGDEERLRPYWEATARRLHQIARAARARGVPVVLVRFPMENAVRHDFPALAAGERLRAIWGETGFPFLDLTESYREALRRGENPFLPYDLHPGPVGMRIAAEELHALIRERDLLPRLRGG